MTIDHGARLTRRAGLALLGGAAAFSAVGLTGIGQAAAGEAIMGEDLYQDVVTYDGFGWHRSGSEGDRRTGAWIAQRLDAAGFATRQETFEVPVANPTRAEVTYGDGATLAGHAQWPVNLTGPSGVSAPLRLLNPYAADQDLAGSIAVIRLTYARHSSLLNAAILPLVKRAVAGEAVAVVIVTTGPSETVIALNAPPTMDDITVPLLCIAPRDAQPLLIAAAAGAPGRVVIDGTPTTTGTAANVVATKGTKGPWIVVSTPLSGWFECAAERGPGIAAYLAIAARLEEMAPKHRLMFVANSGHELENAGAAHLLKEVAPPPSETALWLHLGAGLAARAIYEIPGSPILLPHADHNRYLMGSADLVPAMRTAFAGLAGLENAYPATVQDAAGELRNVLAAGYAPAFGAFGGHPYHHSPEDRTDKTSAAILKPMTDAFVGTLKAVIPTLRG